MAELAKKGSSLFPLTLSQQNIWGLEQTYAETSINNISTTLRVKGRVDFVALQKSIQLVLAADDSLRTQITMDGDRPMQYHAPFVETSFPVFDFSHTSAEGLESWETAVTRQVIPLMDQPLYRFILFRTGENAGGVLIKIHHIISDGWSQVLLCNRIGRAYLTQLSGEVPTLEPSPSYALHVREEADYLASPAYQRDHRYWEDLLHRAGDPSVLKAVGSASVSPVGRRSSFQLPEALNHAIYSFCVTRRVAPFSVFHIALAIYFKRIGGADRFTIGVPIFNRTNYQFKQTTGMFVNTLPFCSEISDAWSFSEFNDRLTEDWYDLLRHQRFPFSDMLRLTEGRRGGGRLFHIALSYQDSKLLESRDASVLFSGRWHYSGYQAEHLCIHLSNLEDNRRYAVDYDYLTQFFSAREIAHLHDHLVNILGEALAAPDKPIHQLSLLPPQEREQVLYSFNRTAHPLYNTDLYARFSEVVGRFPNRTAVIWNGQRFSYRALEDRAAALCALLAEQAMEDNALVAVLLPRDYDLFCAMTGILRAGCAYLLLSPELPDNRISELLAESGAQLLVTSEPLRRRFVPGALPLPVLDASRMDNQPGQAVPPAEAAPEDLAYVVYTSGSTGAPKGVEITRRNLLNFAAAMAPIYGKGAVLSICNVGFDAFVLESVAALLNGRTVVLPEDEALESPARLGRLISSYAVGSLALTPSRLSAFLQHPAFLTAASALESVVCGGEAFPSDLLQRLQLYTNANVYNQYGPSETTVGVSIKRLNRAAQITAGAPMQNCRLYILDDWMNPLPVGIYGNLYVGGLCVGRGYRNAQELTAARFFDSPFVLGDRIYRTGDTACWTPDGEIVLGGRTDQQVKLRGLRVEPREVAACLAAHPGIREAAARVFSLDGQDLLVGFYTSDTPLPEGEVLSFAGDYLPRYMVPSLLRRLDAIPLTPSGKVDEARLPAPVLSHGVTAPDTPLQETLLSIFREVLGREDLGVESDYFLCGGNSLNAMRAICGIEGALGRTLRISDLYACRNVRRLAELLGQAPAAEPVTQGPRLAPAPRLPRYPLSPMQQGIYVQSHIDPTQLAYHMPGAFVLESAPDAARLQAAFRALIAGDPVLRTSFVQDPDGVFAYVSDSVSFALPVLEADSFDAACAAFLRPFDLSRAPLLRAALWEDPDGRWVLLLDVHHIIGDGLSTPLLMRRLDTLFQGARAEARPLSYLDYAYALSAREGGACQTCRSYWSRRLQALPDPLNPPTDFSRPLAFDFRGDQLAYSLSPALSQACDTYCETHGLTSYTLFLAAFGVLLSRMSGKDDLIVGAPVSGRLWPEARDLCGPFINTLPLRLLPRKDQALSGYLSAVREAVMQVLDHQNISLEEIISLLELPRTLDRNPLYQVMFSQRPLDAGAFSLGGQPLTYLPIPTGTAKFDMVLELARENGVYSLQFEYASSLFTRETISFYARCMEALLQDLVSCGDKPVEELRALSPRDKLALLDIPQNTVTPFLNMPIHLMISNQAALAPDETAVIFHGGRTSRRGLEQRANQLANLLAAAGAAPGHQIGLALSRGADLLAGMLAILKAGCAYVPLLAHYPEQRLQYMAETAQITHILCDVGTHSALPAHLPCTLVRVEQPASDLFEAVPLRGDSLAQVMFTSGSTGRPKGVMLAHRALSNLYLSIHALMAPVEGPVLCSTNLVFDTFITETLLPLAMGKTVVMADEEEMMLPWRLAELIQREGVKTVQFTPSRIQMCLTNQAFQEAVSRLDMVLYSGEVLSPLLLRQTRALASRATTVNMYGPTEAAVYCTMTEVDPEGHVNIGFPLKNTRVYILDENRKPVLPTAYGELYLSGECLSKGYISRPDLTENAFVPDPFFPGDLMYRTGDIARLRLDGSYDFLGRADAQVKLNGQRVELDEINSNMVSTGCALQAATVPLQRDDGSMELFTYYLPNPNQPDGEGEVRARLGSILPAYMIPSHLIKLTAMPYTASGKIDLRALKEMAAQGGPQPPQTGNAAPVQTGDATPVQADDAAPVPQTPEAPEAPDLDLIVTPPCLRDPAPVPSPVRGRQALDSGAGTLDWIVALWRQILRREDVAPDRSFFLQGGTSLAALNVLSHYHNHHIVMSLAQFYQNPTAEAQARLFRPDGAPAGQTAAEQAACSAPRHFPAAVPQPAGKDTRRTPRTVLLTGATGFFGAHLLRTLLDTGVSKIICTMRDGSEARLSETLSWYFGSGWVSGVSGQLEVIQGDISKTGLGLSPKDYQNISGRIDAIYHCAADVRHYAADSAAFLRTNLDGTEALIKLARASRASLHHMSTVSVAGERLKGCEDRVVYTEHDFDIGQDWDKNLYLKSKFLAEAAVFDAIRSGVNARVYRLGRLVGRASDGTFQRHPENNAFWLVMRGLHAMGAIPRSASSAPVELTPVDFCADAVAALRCAPMTALHVVNSDMPSLEDVARALIPDLAVLSDEAFEEKLNGAPSNRHGALLSPLRDAWRYAAEEPPTIAFSNAHTMEQLKRAGFDQPKPDPGRLLRAFRFDPSERF